MNSLSPQTLLFLETMLCASVIFMHLAKKNLTVIWLYAAQSLIVSLALFYSVSREFSVLLMAVAIMTVLVKVIFAPYFLLALMRKSRLHFSVSSYLNGPMTLIVLASLTAFSYSRFFQPLTVLAPHRGNALLLAISMVFISIFLIINRRGALSQIAGVLSLENAIVSFAYVTGLEVSAGPEIGIIFDMFVWIVIATVFASMIYRHFGSLNASAMQHLRED